MRPGELNEKEKLDSIMRVDHAGEYGATRIYAGQLAVLKNTKSAKIIQHMAEQEEAHLKKFNELVSKNQVRPTALLPFWHVAGYAMGYATALMGEKAAMACTVAVEEVIDEHYKKQYETLPNSEKELKKTIEKFRQEEIEHRDIGLENGAEEAKGYEVLTKAVKGASKLAIWLSSRV